MSQSPIAADDAALRSDVRRLGDLLGQTLVRQEGPELLALVEEVRKAVREGSGAEILGKLSVEDSVQLVRAFSTYFHLANVAEQVHRARVLAEARVIGGSWLARAVDRIEAAMKAQTPGHEFFHAIQANLAKGNGADAAGTRVPNWYWEGMAQFSQHAAIYSDSFENYTKYRNETSGGILKNSIWTAKYIEGYFQTNLTNEWAAQYPRWRQYDLGAMLVEILVAIKGPDSAMEVFRESVNGSGFESAFQRIYGSSFQSVLPIISRTIALELGN